MIRVSYHIFMIVLYTTPSENSSRYYLLRQPPRVYIVRAHLSLCAREREACVSMCACERVCVSVCACERVRARHVRQRIYVH